MAGETVVTTNSDGPRPRRVYGGLNPDAASAERGIRSFNDAGYPSDRIGVITRDREEGRELAESTGANVAGGAATGVVAGGVLGGIAGLLDGIGALAIP